MIPAVCHDDPAVRVEPHSGGPLVGDVAGERGVERKRLGLLGRGTDAQHAAGLVEKEEQALRRADQPRLGVADGGAGEGPTGHLACFADHFQRDFAVECVDKAHLRKAERIDRRLEVALPRRRVHDPQATRLRDRAVEECDDFRLCAPGLVVPGRDVGNGVALCQGFAGLGG